jgi:hypothetical protein
MEDQRVLKEKSSGIKCSWNLIKMKIKLTRSSAKVVVRRKVYSYECLHQNKTENSQINNLIMHLKILEN